MATRVQRKRVKGWRMPPNTVYVGRPSRWENPFVVGRDGTASECVAKYQDYLLPYRHHEPNSGMDKFLFSEMHIRSIQEELRGKNLACWMHIRSIQEELRGKNLACWCKLGDPCHADWLLEIANGKEPPQ